MQELIERAIIRKAHGLLRKQRGLASRRGEYAANYEKRTGLTAGPASLNDPIYWEYHPHFNPKYCISHSRFLSKVIWSKLQAGTYEPTPALQFDIPKPGGSTRQVMSFSVPDAALSNVLFRGLTRRNINIFSSYSFAYRDDRGVFDAILHLRRSLSWHKSYVIQYDFSSYFDSIDHSFLLKLLFQRRLFLISDAERNGIQAFLKHSYAPIGAYTAGEFKAKTRGVPQGASISLFLSNAAAHDLDLLLEGQNGIFTRFADDVVAITRSYGDALAVAQAFRIHCKDAGLGINHEKSPGIQLFVGGSETERRDFVIETDDGSLIENISHIDYVGHRIVSGSGSRSADITLPDKAIKRAKRRIGSIIYIHLLQHRRDASNPINPARLGGGFVDWDMVTCINEIRKYLYGGLKEEQIVAFLSSNRRLPFVRGMMGFLPLISRIEQLAELDGWLLSAVRRANRERSRVATSQGLNLPLLSEGKIISGDWYDFPSLPQETVLPSFVRAWRASRRYYRRYGLSGVESVGYYD